jgi:hypothetical protein
MRPLTQLLALPLLLTACRNPEVQLSVAAPPGALECAMRAAGENGYALASDGSERLARPLFGREGDPGPYEATDPDKAQLQDYLTITMAGDSLRFVAVGASVSGKSLRPSPRTVGHIDEIIAACAPGR